jgi:citrate lyase subunit beta/citryl-CoA lyase
MRSLLFVPADQPRKLEKAASSEADVLVLDLEDSVAADAKQRARDTMSAVLAEHRPSVLPSLYVRVNALKTGLTADDLTAALALAPRGIMLPKAEGRADIQHLSVMLRVAEAKAGLVDGSTQIIAVMTETARAIIEGRSYRGASARLAGLTWGAEDLSADIGASASRDETGALTNVYKLARAVTLLAAADADVPAIDTVFVDFRDDRGLKAECISAARDGFTAKMAIHPAQIPIINACFSPTPESIAEARAVIDAFSKAGGAGVASLDGKMIDRPHLRRAERILARATALL